MPNKKRFYSSDSDSDDVEKKRSKLQKKLKDLDRKQKRRKYGYLSDSSESFESSLSEASGNESHESNINQAKNSKNETLEQEQDPEILKLLGEEPSGSEVVYGNEVHQALADRWSKYLTLGVEKNEIEAMDKKYLIPKNIPYLKAPILNPELESSLSDHGKKEEKYFSTIQGNIGLGLSALSKCIDIVLKDEVGSIEDIKNQLLPLVVDASKIMCGAFNMISTNRKYHIGTNLTHMVKKIVKESKPDEFLCGKNFADKFREVKTQIKTGKEMKNSLPAYKKFPSAPTSSTSSTIQRSSSLNYQRMYAKGRKKEKGMERPQKRERKYSYVYKNPNKRHHTK